MFLLAFIFACTLIPAVVGAWQAKRDARLGRHQLRRSLLLAGLVSTLLFLSLVLWEFYQVTRQPMPAGAQLHIAWNMVALGCGIVFAIGAAAGAFGYWLVRRMLPPGQPTETEERAGGATPVAETGNPYQPPLESRL